MKYLRLYENENVYLNYLDQQKKLDKTKEKILPLIDQWMKLNKDKWNEWGLGNYEYAFDFYNKDENTINLEFVSKIYKKDEDEEAETIIIAGEDMQDFLEFMDHPDLYADTKKYNL